MREFKFRVWDKKEKEFLQIKHFGFEDSELWYVQAIDENEKDIDPPHFPETNEIEIMQYTGLKDKNGVEIYEGDILEYYDLRKGVFIFKEQPKRKEVIRWSQNDAQYRIPDMGFRIDTEKVEVIGNIHENPELISTTTK